MSRHLRAELAVARIQGMSLRKDVKVQGQRVSYIHSSYTGTCTQLLQLQVAVRGQP